MKKGTRKRKTNGKRRQAISKPGKRKEAKQDRIKKETDSKEKMESGKINRKKFEGNGRGMRTQRETTTIMGLRIPSLVASGGTYTSLIGSNCYPLSDTEVDSGNYV